MRALTILCVGLVCLALPALARAADPIMPLSEVEPGMQCTGLSVFKGIAVEPFAVEIVDVVGEATIGSTRPRLLVRVSGERVDETGVGPGFSGSPIYCPGADGAARNAGAISETIGDYGGKTVLATPIEQILGVPVKATTAKTSRREAYREARLLSRSRPIATPISIAGVSDPIMRALRDAARKQDVAVMESPEIPADRAPEVPLVPGSAMGVGLSSGDVTLSGIGTVSYVDGDKLWAYGHQFDAAGKRSLLLQDAYIATIINNPLNIEGYSTYKLGGAVRDRGTISNDGFDAVAGTLGELPPRTDVRVVARDLDRNLRKVMEIDVADEADVGNPTGFTALTFAPPIAVGEAATTVLESAPQRVAGRMCMSVDVREIDDELRFCNRYVSDGTGYGAGINPVASSASGDAYAALSIFEAFKGDPVHVEDVSARIVQTRAQRQAYIRNVFLPDRVRRGATVPVKLVARIVRGPVKVFRFDWKVPTKLQLGTRKLDFRGTDPDGGFGFGFFDELIIEFGAGGYFDSEGPRSVDQLTAAFRRMDRYDGIRLRKGGRVFRDETYRIGGRDVVRVRVLRERS